MSDWSWQAPHIGLLALLALAVLAQLVVILRSTRSPGLKSALTLLNVLFAVLLWLFLQPPARSSVTDTLLLVTPGFTEAELGRAQRARNAVSVGTDPQQDVAHSRITSHVDLASVRLAYPHATTLKILGAGLDSTYWNADSTWRIQFDAPAMATALRHVDWPRRIEVGEPLRISGRVHGAANATVQLLDPAGDVVERKSLDRNGAFTMSAQTRSAGRFSYRIALRDAGDTVIETQPLPVHIAEPAPVNLLVLLSAPSFESRYLKHWAGLGGARLAVRTTLSEDRYRNEFVARDALALDRLTRANVASFDVIVADQRAWQTLGDGPRAAILAAVEQDGLGIAIMALDAARPLYQAQYFPTLTNKNPRDRALSIKDAASSATTVTLAAAQFADDLPDEQVIVRDVAERAVAAFRPLGKGRVGITLVTDSHKLVTAGNAQQHARYWRTFIYDMAPRSAQPDVEIYPSLPQRDQRLQLCMFGESLPTDAVIGNTQRIALRAQPRRPGERCGYWWPRRAGWHTLGLGDITRQVYIFEHGDWSGVRQSNASAATALASEREPATRASVPQRRHALPRWWFALALLAVVGLLWLEQKLRDG